MMELQIKKRTVERKSDAKKVRRDGGIPAIIYGKGSECEAVSIPTADWDTLMRKITPGHLSTTVLTLKDEAGKTQKVIVKDIQYHVTTYNVVHLDFEELHDDIQVNVRVPIECTGAMECVGVKLGGAIRQVQRYLKVRCLPKDIPAVFQVDVSHMNLHDSKRLVDLAVPSSVRPLDNLNTVAVAITKR